MEDSAVSRLSSCFNSNELEIFKKLVGINKCEVLFLSVKLLLLRLALISFTLIINYLLHCFIVYVFMYTFVLRSHNLV